MTPAKIITKIDTTNLNKGIALAHQVTKREVRELCDRCAYYIAVDAQKGTPFVSVEKIDAELSVVVNPIIGLRGKALKSKKTFASMKMVGVNSRSGIRPVPLAALIINNMVSKKKRPFLGNDQKFPLDRSPFKGFSRALGAQKMAAYISKLISSRHRATHYLASGWSNAIGTLGATLGFSSKRGAKFGGQKLGSAVPAKTAALAQSEIINNVGAEGPDKVSANSALHAHATAALQTAIDRRGKREMEYAMRKLEQQVARATKPLWT